MQGKSIMLPLIRGEVKQLHNEISERQGRTVDPDCPCRMPNVKERIAGKGIRFDLGYTPNALCAPARASFFTGLYPSVHGMYNNYHSMPVIHVGLYPGVKLFSQHLRNAGYNLSYIGK
ncbi:hypothetical protein CW712_02320 [Candidatus Bathyarchaeota archaeon]|nr:MAG: hypothetical protein CW712_02320 [Candidatus Bathyarchaeota archaeon]